MRIRYAHLDPDLLRALRSIENLRKLFDDLVLRTGGDVDEAMGWMRELQRRGYIDPSFDLEAFFRSLEQSGDVERIAGGARRLTAKATRALRRGALDLMFGSLRRGGPLGDHATRHEGEDGERLAESRPYRFGDPLGEIDGTGSIREALRRGDLDLHLQPEDLRVWEREHVTACATVLLLDVSHSMVLYGEDRITPAKQVALALAELIERKYPKDSLDVVLFGDEAKRVSTADLPYVQAGPYHTNTRAALQLGRRILQKKRLPNRRIVMITDGKPSALTEGGRIYKNSFGLDERIVNRTIEEAIRCRRARIPITTFMITDDPYLRGFVEELTRANRGQAYFASPDDVGSALFVDYLRNRRRRT